MDSEKRYRRWKGKNPQSGLRKQRLSVNFLNRTAAESPKWGEAWKVKLMVMVMVMAKGLTVANRTSPSTMRVESAGMVIKIPKA
jgi:hypothetical protein